MIKGSIYQRAIKTAATAVLMVFGLNAQAQNTPDLGTISGNFQIDGQYYIEDTVIQAPDFPANLGSNSFVNLRYRRGKFSAGIRYEAYLPTMQGFLRESGSGIPYRFAEYTHDKFDVTLGNFYEQFGSGMILRAYEEWGLGFDNSIDGARVRLRPGKGFSFTGMIGRQRNAFSNKNGGLSEGLSEGIVRGFDGEWLINDAFSGLSESKTKVRIGGSFLSRFQPDNDPIQIFPENVGTMSGRISINRKGLNFGAEYVHKINDPSAVNQKIYKDGNALLLRGSYSKKGFGVSVAAKRVDNFDWRSDRNADGNNLLLTYLPAQTRQHTYRLSTLFPYATQTVGEFGLQAEVLYKIPRKTTLGGPYGTNITLNFSQIHDLNRLDPEDPDDGYTTEFLDVGDLFFQDINVEISRKFNKKFKATASYLHFKYEKNLFKNLTGFNTSEEVSANVFIVDLSYRLAKKKTLRVELQHAGTKQEFGSWAMGLAELTLAPHWFFSVMDEYNYGNAEESQRLHYYSFNSGYSFDNYRITVGYGRQRQGVLCVGGVCRFVPAANGPSISIVGTF